MTSQASQEEIPVTVGSDNVFADLGFANPEEEQLKARLAYQIMRAIKRLGLSQAKAAKLLGVSQPNVSNLARGHYEDFSIDRLIRFLKTLGTDVEILLKPTATVAMRSVADQIEEAPDVSELVTRLEAEADQEIAAGTVTLRWGSEQIAVVKRAAALLGVPYQTYLKDIAFKQALMDIEHAEAELARQR